MRGRHLLALIVSSGILSTLALPQGNTDLQVQPVQNLTIGFKCLICHWGADLLVSYARHGDSQDKFFGVVTTACYLLGLESKIICKNMVKTVGEQLFDILREGHGAITARDICGLVEEGECAAHSPRMNTWKLDIPDLNQTSPISTPRLPSPDKPKTKVLQISDPHVQWDYQVGALANCGEPICCSAVNGFPPTKDNAASFYGDYHCDLPPWTLDMMFKEIRAKHPDIDFVIMTGDLPAHDIWRQNRTLNLESSEIVIESMKKHFGDLPLFPAIGNHESFPVNMFPGPNSPDKYNPSWLYANMAKFYQHWLPGQDQQETLSNGGYYTQLVRPGLRIVSVNTNVCNNFNFFLLLNFDDPWRHLHWLYRVLHKAEAKKEVVYVIGHIPPGRSSCYTRWAHEYGRLVRRFNNTILGQFFGHTHFDEFETFFNDNSDVPVSVAYLAPGLTSHQGLNPAYRIYEIDGNYNGTTSLVLDHSTYYFDLDQTIKRKQLVHVKEYSALEDLNLADLSPQSWFSYVMSLAKDSKEFDKYFSRYFHQGPAMTTKCDKRCKKKLLCHLLTAESGNPDHCQAVHKALDLSEPALGWWDFVKSYILP